MTGMDGPDSPHREAGREMPQLAPPSPSPSPSRSRSRGRRVVRAFGWTLAASGIAALAGFSGYLWLTHEQWVDQNEQLRAEAGELGEELAVARADADAQTSALERTQSQLEEAKATISGFADEDANASDGFRFATDVIEGLQNCADERAELIGYLKESSRYTTSSLRAAESDIDAFCADVEQSWADYLDEDG